jgi:YVTN family beta-propeller protein
VFTEVNNTRHDMMCGGTAMLPDGRVVVNGGRNTTVLSSIFDFRTNQWNPLQNMNDGRWYNPSVALPDGSVFTVSGWGGSNTAELWNSSSGWRRLNGIDWSAVTNRPGNVTMWHPFLMLAPNGKLFHFGPTDTMNWVDPTGVGNFGPSGQSVPAPYYPKDSAWAMYDEGRILVAGGSQNANYTTVDGSINTSSNATYTVNLNGLTPVITPSSPMAFTRQFANSVILPNGEVMVIGGNTTGIGFNDTGSILTPEIWNPQSAAWRTLADIAVPRNYHSLALLLPDGRVWSGGGGLGGNAADHQDAQIYTPSALFSPNGSLATRPKITQGPDRIGLGSNFTVRGTSGLTKFALIRMAAQTHSVSTDLRYLSLPFTESSSGVYTVTSRSNRNVMLPGYWMLFALNSNGVHSVAKIIKVEPNTNVTIDNPGDRQFKLGDPVTIPISVTSLPSITINYSATGLPGGLTIHPASGIISGSVTAAPGIYGVTVTATPDSGANVTTAFNLSVRFPATGSGTILREWWLDIAGATLSNLTDSTSYPTLPAGRQQITALETPPSPADNFGQRIRGYLHPPITGIYRFWIASDDESRLELSTTSNPADSGQIASVPSWTNPREWTKFGQQASVAINLELGKRYYIEALMKEGGGGDHLAVAWQVPGSSEISVIQGENLSPFDPSQTPTAAWHLDEGSWNGAPGEVKEIMGTTSNIHGIAIGGATTASTAPAQLGNPGTGGFGTFNGIAQYVRIPFNAALNPKSFTLSAWVRPTSVSASQKRSIMGSREKSGNSIDGFGVFISPAGTWSFSTGSASADLSGPTVLAGRWSHVTASFRVTSESNGVVTGIRRIYVDGLQVAQDTGTYTPTASSPLLIGASENGSGIGDYMNGSIDEVRVYAMPLSESDIVDTMGLRHPFNSAPSLTQTGNLADIRNSIISQAFEASDAEGDPLTFSAVGLPPGLTISATGGIVSGSPDSLGDFTTTIRVADPSGGLGSVSFIWSIVEELAVTPRNAAPAPSGTSVAFSATASGGKNPRFRWNFGDGSPETSFSNVPDVNYTYPGPGRYLATVTVTDDTDTLVTRSFYQAIHAPLTPKKPVASSAIAYEDRVSQNDRVWTVNPDNDSVSVVDTVTRAKLAEIPVGVSPRCIAIAPNGSIWVTNHLSSTLSIISSQSLTVLNTLSLPRGSGPFGLVFSPIDAAAFVTLEESGKLLKLDSNTGTVLSMSEIGTNVRHLSITGDGASIFASRFITRRINGEQSASVDTTGQGGEVLELNPITNSIIRTMILSHSERPDTSISARGIPNYLGAPTVSPDGLSAWVPSKQDNIKRGKLRDNNDLTHDMSVRAIASRIDLAGRTEDMSARIDFDNAGMPGAIAFDPWGIYAFVALEASRSVAVFDLWNRREIIRFPAGRAPQGLTLSPDGETLYVYNFMDRTVSIHDVSALIQGLSAFPPAPVIVSTIAEEKLPAQVLIGKQLFYDAKDNRLALQEYLSCASCHNDGGQDGRVWDFTGFGEGLRNTISLRGHGGTSQGPLHWSANFDEVQDFENQIRTFAEGTGLISGSPHPPLGTPNAGRSPDLDAISAYLQSLNQSDRSPLRESDGSLSSTARAGEWVFRTLDCASCHGGTAFTRSAAGSLPNIGTLKPSSGTRLGGNLSGIDIPTLRGIWNTAPYLHDGSAATLAQAVTAHQGVTINTTDLTNLVAYLGSIDDQPATAPLPMTQFEGWAQISPGADGDPMNNADGDLFPDLLEFALGGLPNTGTSPADNAITLEESAGSLSLVVTRPTGLRDLTFEVLASGNLSTWTPAPAPTIQPAGNGLERLRFENLQSLPGLTPDSGFARLRVSSTTSSVSTLPLGWQAVDFGSNSRTVGIPLREDPVFSSSVTGTTGMRLLVNGDPPSSGASFVEVTTGSFAGNRFEVASTAAGEITISPSPLNTLAALPDLTQSQVILCKHQTLGGIFNKSLFKGSTNPAAADQVQFYVNNGTTGQFQLFYLLDARPGNPTHQWRAFLPGGGDQGNRVISPGEGILLKRPGSAPATRLLLRGQVRANPFIQPLQRGINLVASPFPTPLSPQSRGLMNPSLSFLASTNINVADQFQLYQSGAFRLFYLLDHPTEVNQWRETVPGSPNYNNRIIFEPTYSVFLKRNQPALNYLIPRSWNP